MARAEPCSGGVLAEMVTLVGLSFHETSGNTLSLWFELCL